MGLFLQVGAFYGGNIGALLSYWEQAGFFSYVLPFLLIFAITFGILTKSKLFENKGLNAVISIAVGLLALQFDFVPLFFSELFPRFGIGLSIILVALICFGLFLPNDANNKYVGWIGLILAIIIFLFVIGKSFGSLYWFDTGFFYDWFIYAPEIITIVIILGAIIAVISSVGNNPKINVPPYGTPVWRT